MPAWKFIYMLTGEVIYRHGDKHLSTTSGRFQFSLTSSAACTVPRRWLKRPTDVFVDHRLPENVNAPDGIFEEEGQLLLIFLAGKITFLCRFDDRH